MADGDDDANKGGAGNGDDDKGKKDTPKKGDGGGNHDDNLKKALDSEREENKILKQKIKDKEDADAKAKADADRKKAEDKGEYEKILAQKDEEITKFKSDSERLQKILDDAKERNTKTLDSIEDKDQKELAQMSIEGKDPMEAQKILGKFSSLLGGDQKPKKKGGDGIPNDKKNQDGAGEAEIEKLKEKFEKIAVKKRAGEYLTPQDERDVVEIPKQIKALRDKKD